MLDGNTAALRIYERNQEKAEEAGERYAQACHERALDLMLTDYRHDTLEAIDETLSERGEGVDRQLRAALAVGPEAFGAAIYAAAFGYRYNQAMNQAKKELNPEDYR